MGQVGADRAGPAGTSSGSSAIGADRTGQPTPLWMDEVPAVPEIRRGSPPPRGSGLNTLLFFGLITVVVAVAGIVGVAVWGPEKTVRNRSYLASAPAAESASAPAAEPVAQAAEPAEPPASPEPSATADTPPAESSAAPAPPPKKGKKAAKKKR